MKLSEFFKEKKWPSWTPVLLAGVGALLYLIQAVVYAHTTVSSLDEGSYLIKGIFYWRGVYEPFQPYGPLTNKAPFAFLIPGFAEYLFGAGLRTGRYFSIFLGLLTVLGVWVTARRWAGRWMAAGTVWVFALSPMIIKLHARTVSEVVIASMLAWMCVLVLDEERPLWQIVLGTVLATFAVLTRQNMVLILPLLILYIFWQHGKQKGIWAFVTTAVVFLAVHAYYWPNILTIWAPWLPDSLTPFLDGFRLPKDSTPVWDPSIDFWNRTNAFFQGMRYHFIALAGGIFAIMFWAPRSDWKTAPAFRAAVFLALSYFILFAMHAWAALASQYESYSCVFCFSNYLSFFDPLGILLFVIVLSAAWKSPRPVVQGLAIIFVIVFSVGIGFSLFENIGSGLLNLSVPRMRDGQFLPGTTTLADILKYKFSLELTAIKRAISSAIGFMAGMGILLIAFLIRLRTKDPQKRLNFALVSINLYLVVGLLLSPVLHLGESRLDCKQDMILAHEQLGTYLSTVIPPNSLVYWDGGNAFTPMVYTPQVRIFPIQINDGYTYRIGGDPETLHRFNHWNDALGREWREAADVFIIEGKRFSTWKEYLTPQAFEEYAPPPAAPTCYEGGELRIFYRIP
ncbi:MAG: glycosyltransferase family 39 protein [Anaerolineales bacterium]|nr:glycosyltransferase family 39 protein [Anaerolineales bacterium]